MSWPSSSVDLGYFSYLKTLVENVHRGLVFTTDKQLASCEYKQ